MTRLAAISVDLDAVRHYRNIHGLPARPGERDPVSAVAVPRLAAWAEALGIPLTWFVVGVDLEQEALSELLFGLSRRGHELANHSLDHCYDLTRHSVGFMREQVMRSSERLSLLTGHSSHGFRAPGYTMTNELHAVLRELAVPYDSSVFPCPVYYGAKAVALLGQRAFGRVSHAILDDPRVLLAPKRPYRMGEDYHREGLGVLQLPIQVTPGLRLPFIGTTLALLGPALAKALTANLIGEPFINLELHGIDALDQNDGLEDLAAVQRDLRIPWQHKLATFGAVVRRLRAKSYGFVVLARAAVAFAARPTGSVR